jgi:uncharacterized protein (TIGR03067 family)
MRRVLVCLCVLAAGFAPAPLPRPERGRADSAEADLAAMQGTWRVKSQSVGGGESKADAEGWRLVVSGPRMRYVRPNGLVSAEFEVILNARARPKAMDLLGGDPKAEKVLWKGTYAFRGKELLMSFPHSSTDREDRPTACAPGPKRLFEVCERVRP